MATLTQIKQYAAKNPALAQALAIPSVMDALTKAAGSTGEVSAEALDSAFRIRDYSGNIRWAAPGIMPNQILKEAAKFTPDIPADQPALQVPPGQVAPPAPPRSGAAGIDEVLGLYDKWVQAGKPTSGLEYEQYTKAKADLEAAPNLAGELRKVATPSMGLPSFSSDLGEVFKSTLGREATPQELEFFKPSVEKGEISPYEVGQILQGTPEYQQSLLNTQTKQLGDVLGQGDVEYMNRAGDVLQSQFARQGRTITPGASSYTQAFANTARDMALQRQGQIANYYGAGLGDIARLGVASADQAQSRGQSLADMYRQRQFDLENMEKQRAAGFALQTGQQNFQQGLLNQQYNQARQGAIGRGLGSAIGAGLGGLFALPTGGLSVGAGAALGGMLGSQAGGLFKF